MMYITTFFFPPTRLHKEEKVCVSSGLQDEGYNPFDAVSRNKAEDSGFICWRHKTSITARSNKANWLQEVPRAYVRLSPSMLEKAMLMP